MINDTTLLLCIDNDHIEELKFAYQTWSKYKPELVDMPKFLIYDKVIENRLNELKFLNRTFTLYPFMNVKFYSCQRDAMLTSFFEGIANLFTKYYIKIDTDCYAVNDDKNWIRELKDREQNVFISNPWGYTKIPERILRLEDWGDRTSYLQNYPRLNYIIPPNATLVSHPRIISWFFYGTTKWTNEMSSACKIENRYELPVASQDTFMWYCAERSKSKYKRTRFKRYGFVHGRMRKYKETIVL